MYSFFFLLLQSDQSLLSPATIAIITALVTIVIGAVGTTTLVNRVHDSSRIKGLWSALVAAYGTIAPFISTFPRGIGVVLAVLGLLGTLTSARLQGPATPSSSSQSGRASVGVLSGLCGLLAIAIFAIACSTTLFTGFRIGLAASKPLVQSLVVSGVITQGHADDVVAGITSAVDIGFKGETCLKAIAPGLPKGQKQLEKAKCYETAAFGIRDILKAHHIGGAPLLDQIAIIAQGAIDAFEEYVRSVRGGSSAVSIASSAGADQAAKGADADKLLEAKMKSLVKQMKAMEQKR